MKLLITLMFLFLINQFPKITSNVSEEEKSRSIIYNLFNGNKTFLIAYTNESYWWSDKKYYQVIAFDDNKWEQLIISSKRYKNGKWSKPKLSRKPINPNVANNLIANLSENSFWTLENNIINKTAVNNEDGTVSKYKISDGVNYKFEILSGNDFRIIEAYEPEYFMKTMPSNNERETFIKCKTVVEHVFQK